MTKERPILFSGAMVRAVLREVDPKTQTRRVCKASTQNQADILAAAIMEDMLGADDGTHEKAAWESFACPYGKPGDRLWVRENWSHTGEAVWSVADARSRGRGGVIYQATDAEPCPGCWWPSIHMPREFSRILLEITGVRVERLQEILDADILAEGVTDDLIKGLVLPGADKCAVLDEHWVHGGDASLSYCHECCVKEVARLKKENPEEEFLVDGGWGIEGDGTAWCETCSHRLSNSLTDYGAEKEFKHFLEHGVDLKNPDDCLSLYEALSSQLWTADNLLEGYTKFERERWIERVELMHKVCWRVLWDSINGKQKPGKPDVSWSGNPYVWVVKFKRVEGRDA